MACRFPGGANDAESYWRLLCDGVDAIRETPPDRWDANAFYDPDPAAPGKMNTRWGGYLDRIDEFDNHFFGISDREAVRIDPQQRILLELAWEALEDAGLPPAGLRGSRTGVFVGIAVSEYGMMLSADRGADRRLRGRGHRRCAWRPTACRSPSACRDRACRWTPPARRPWWPCTWPARTSATASAKRPWPAVSICCCRPSARSISPRPGSLRRDGRVRAFDAAATGYVRSDGAGLVMLKPLTAALHDNDPIYAVIRGSAVNQNGTSNGLTAPSRPAQEQVLREAYSRAKVSPGQVQYVETQGTGTRLGDTIEAMALGNVLRDGRAADSRCAIGSVKTNIGHMEAASGIASLMKAALALEHRQLPPNLHFQTPNPDIPFDRLPLRVVRRT